MQRILIVKTSAIGDVIQASSCLSYIKSKFPNVKIDWVVEESCKGLMKAHPLVNDVIVIDTKKWRKNLFSLSTWKEIKAFISRLQQNHYDVLFDLQGNCKSSFIDFFAKAHSKVGFGRLGVAERPNLLFTSVQYDAPLSLGIYDRYLYLAKRFFCDEQTFKPAPIDLSLTDGERLQLIQIVSTDFFHKKNLYMLSFGSNWENKRLSLRTLKEFIAWATKDLTVNFVVTYYGTQEEMWAKEMQDVNPSSVLALGGLSLPLWQHVMKHTSGVVCMDSAALSLAAISDIPSLGVFGPTSSFVYQPKGKIHLSAHGFCPYSVSFTKRCPHLRTCRTGACIKDISLSFLQTPFERLVCSKTQEPILQITSL